MSSYGNYPQQPDYGQQPGGRSEYGQVPAYGQQQPGYGQQSGYPQPYGYGVGGPPPSRPPAVTTAAVLGFILGALATVGAIFLFAGGGALSGLDDGGIGVAGALSGILFVLALLVLTLAVLMIWGSVLAISGRSRVLLIVGASLLAALGLISFLGSLGNPGTDAGGIISQLIGLVMSIAIIVLLSLAPAAQYFAAQRARRGR